MMLSLYRLATAVGAPVIRFYLSRRMDRGKEDPERFGERLGRPGRARPEGPLVWLHAASVGESISVLPLIERLRTDHPELAVLLTTGTVTSARLMADRLPEGTFHQYIPVDRLAYVRSFLDHWRPDLTLWAESEFWPNLVTETAHREIPLILINGRVSDRSFARWRKYPGTIARLLRCFAHVMGQSETDTERLRALGASGAVCPGNLKYASPPLPADPEELAGLSATTEGRPVWLAASTHDGEEELCGRIQRDLKVAFPRLLTVIVPRHPERGEEIAGMLRALGLGVALRSAGEGIAAETDVYVADTIGELGLFYRLSEVSFIGKSLASSGGQNPLEAAALGRPVLFGPQMTNFREIAARMVDVGAAAEVPDAAGLQTALGGLLADEALRKSRGEAGAEYAAGEARVLDRVMSEIAPFIGRVLRREGDDEAA